MKNIILICLAVTAAFMFTACEKSNLNAVVEKSSSSEENQGVVLKNLENQKELLLTNYKNFPSSTSRTNQPTDIDFSMENATVGISFLVDGVSIYDIPDCTVSITDNGDFNTYTITAIDRFEEVENTNTYTLELDILKVDGTFVARPFSIAWPKFSAWAVPNVFLFGYWDAEILAEDEEQLVVEVPLMDPFFIYRQMIDMEAHDFMAENFEGVVRITALKQ